jgi:hypothetical protein
MLEGNLIGHIISKDGIKIDPSRVEAIQNIGFPRSKKEVQSFLGKVNFLRRFIPNFVENSKSCDQYAEKGKHYQMDYRSKGVLCIDQTCFN